MKRKLKKIITKIVSDPYNSLDGLSYHSYNKIAKIIKEYSDLFSLYGITSDERDNILYKGEILYRT